MPFLRVERVLHAVTSAERSSNLVGVPTVDESGVQGYEVSSWFGLLAPAGTPPPVGERLRSLGAESADIGPVAFAELMRKDSEKWRDVIRKANVRLED